MCLAIPMTVVKIEGPMGVVEYNGVERKVGLMLLDDVKLGDWVLVHAGFAISKIDYREAQETLDLLRQMGEAGP